jgi:hypothetical protein
MRGGVVEVNGKKREIENLYTFGALVETIKSALGGASSTSTSSPYKK